MMNDLNTAIELSIASSKNQNVGNSSSGSPVISENGRYIGFRSSSSTLFSEDVELSEDEWHHYGSQVFVKDLGADELFHVTNLGGWLGDGDIDSADPLAINSNGDLLFASDQKWVTEDNSYSDQSDVYLWKKADRSLTLLTNNIEGDAKDLDSNSAKFADNGNVLIEAYVWDYIGDQDHNVLIEANINDNTNQILASAESGSLSHIGETKDGHLIRKAGEANDGSYEQLYYLNSDGQFFQTEQLRSINSNAFSLNTVGTDVTLTADGSAIGFISSSPLLDGYVETDRHAYIAYLNTGSINLIDTDKDGNPVQYDGSLPENERYPLQDNHNSAFHDGTGWLALDDYGNYAAFGTWRRESDLAGHLGGESRVDIFLKDLKTNEVVRVDNNTTNSGGISLLMSGDGSKIIFDTSEKQIEKDTNNARDIYIANNPFHVSPEIYGGDFLKLGYALKGNDNTGNPGGDAQVLGVDDTGLTNVAVLGPNTFDNKTYTLEISAESLKDGWDLESADIVLKYDTKLFEKIDFDDIQIGGDLPISNAVDIDDVNGLIRIAAASLGSLGLGDSIDNEAIFASIKVDFDESYFEDADRTPDANGKFTFEGKPLGFELSANSDETVFSRTFASDSDGFEVTGGAFTNREIQSLGDLNGMTIVDEGKVNLYQAEIKFQEQDGGLILGTKRVIGSGSGFTNLLRKGDLITARTSVENIGNSLAKDVYIEDAGNVAGANFTESRFISKTSNGMVTALNPNSNIDLKGGEFKSTVANSMDTDEFVARFMVDLELNPEIFDVVNVGDFSRSIVATDSVSIFETPGSTGLNLDLGNVGSNTNILLFGGHIANNAAFKVAVESFTTNSAMAVGDAFLAAYSDGANSYLTSVTSPIAVPDNALLNATKVSTLASFDGISDITALSKPGAFAGIINDAIDYPYDPSTQESTEIEIDVSITGDAGDVVDLTKGLFKVSAKDTEQNQDPNDQYYTSNQGSKNLITFQGDLNYDGRVSMKDLAYLNAGAARQQTTTENPTGEDLDGNGVVDASVATDVDANFDKEISLADLAVLDADWGKTLHTGDEQFQGSAPIQDSAAVSWIELDSQGDNATWDNSSFKDQNSIEAEDSYVGSLESPTSTGVIGADGNTTANDNDITGTEFQDSIPA